MKTNVRFVLAMQTRKDNEVKDEENVSNFR